MAYNNPRRNPQDSKGTAADCYPVEAMCTPGVELAGKGCRETAVQDRPGHQVLFRSDADLPKGGAGRSVRGNCKPEVFFPSLDGTPKNTRAIDLVQEFSRRIKEDKKAQKGLRNILDKGDRRSFAGWKIVGYAAFFLNIGNCIWAVYGGGKQFGLASAVTAVMLLWMLED